jgi:predicted amidohydrolase YtcJ
MQKFALRYSEPAVRLLCAALFLAIHSPAADLVLRNGKVITLDASLPQASAIAVTNGRISGVGSDAQIAREIGPATRVIDLHGRVAIPGFIDGHAHFTEIGEAKTILNLRNARTWDEIVAMVAAAAREAKPGDWIAGGGWHQEKWDKRPEPNVRGFPVEESLSRVSPNNPVLLTHVSGHAVFVNRAALARAGVTRATPDPPGGEILKDPQGNPTGLLNESAQALAKNAMARDLASRTEAEKAAQAQRVIDLASQEILSKGITSFEDAGSPPDVIARLKLLADSGRLAPRLWVMLRISNAEFEAKASKYRTIGEGDNHLTVRAIKRYMDGALGSRGAWMLAPYADLPSSSGLNVEDLKDIEQTARIAIANGYQLCIHAIGDRANREVLDLYERIFREHPEKKDLRWRVEHSQHLSPQDIPRFARLGVIASMQGIHATSDAAMVIPRLGQKRAQEGAYVWRSLIDSGAHVSNGTDAPVEDVDPIANYYATVTRRTASGQEFFPAQRMTRLEGLRSYTVEPAYAAFEDNLKGRLKVGMLGDIAVLSQDLLTVPDQDILKTRVEYTIVGGKIAWQRDH